MWLILTLILLLAGFLLAWLFKKRHPKLRTALLLCMAVCTLLVTAGTAACWNPPEYQNLTPDYAVLLGGGEKDGQPTASTENRLFLALDYLEATPDVPLIVTGGDPNGNGVTEAEIMASWLRDHGADMDRILIEDRANDTLENLLYSKALAASRGLETDSILILTSDYHQTRAQFLARQLGQEAAGLACETPFLSRLAASVREVYSFVKAIWQTR